MLSSVFFDVHADIDTFPTWGLILIQLIACLYIEDFVHYVEHRILHTSALYRRIHKTHHEFKITFALAGNYADPIETILLSIATFLPGLLVPKMHLFTFYFWILYRWVDAAIEHCGYDIVPHILPFQGGVPFHDQHHTQFTRNFGSRFTLFDKLFGTYSDPNTKKTL